MIGIIVSAVLSRGLSYRSALLRISCTDQLTGLLNRRGFDEAAKSALANARRRTCRPPF
jgi:GGDEF domain-containing protein